MQNKKNKELKQNLVTWREDDKICELEINELIVKKKEGLPYKKHYSSCFPPKP